MFHGFGEFTLFEGRNIKGWPKMALSREQVIFEENQVTDRQRRGNDADYSSDADLYGGRGCTSARGIDGLARVRREVLKTDFFSESLFVFRNKRPRRSSSLCMVVKGSGFIRRVRTRAVFGGGQ